MRKEELALTLAEVQTVLTLAEVQTALEECFPSMNMKQIEEFVSFHYKENSVFESLRRCIEDDVVLKTTFNQKRKAVKNGID